MKQIKTSYLIALLGFLLVIVVAISLWQSRSVTPPKPTGPLSNAQKYSNLYGGIDFKIASTSLNSQLLGITQFITIKFTKPANIATLNLAIEPDLKKSISFNTDMTELTIAPSQAWNFDTTYVITIYKDTRSIDGQRLNKDSTFTFKTMGYTGI